MTEQNSDILVKIPDNKLPKLVSFFKEKAPWAPYMTSFFQRIIKWQELDKFHDVYSVTSPKNSWEDDGTIITIFQFAGTVDIIVFTLDPEGTNLYEGLFKTNRIDYSKRICFFAVHENHHPIVKKFLNDKKIKIADTVPTYIYLMSPEDANNLKIDCPPEVVIKNLEPSAAKLINSRWPHRYENSEAYLASFIEVNGGCGVFLKSTNELVAWVIKHSLGHLGMLQTEDNHKKKGYGSLVAKALAKEIAQDGFWPMGTILINNEISMSMFEKLGFHRSELATFIILE